MAAILLLGLVGMVSGQGKNSKDDNCIYRTLGPEDATFCKGNLSVIYKELGNINCMYVPACNNYRWKIGIWDKPLIRYYQANKKKKYLLMMVDPDAPSKNHPKYRYWRHWLIANISGTDLKTGKISGNELTSYHGPTPPPETGFHRYQFILFEESDKGKPVTLTSKENARRDSWSIGSFIKHFHLGPVAASQFMTQNYNDF